MGRVGSLKPMITKLSKFEQDEGCVMHGIKVSDSNFNGFGEAYFSSVNYKKSKGWKLHERMTLNLIVPFGKIRFIIHDALDNSKIITPLLDITLGENNYSRLTIPPGYWVAFKGAGLKENILLNVADIEHDPDEAINKPLNYFKVSGYEQS
jgi:dTDP-4-dehydrorhamnose 3,5-epimerase